MTQADPHTARMVALMERLAPVEGYNLSALEDVRFLRSNRPLSRTPVLYDPGVVILCQGRKRGYLGNDLYVYDARHYLVVSVPVPFTMETDASEAEPMLAVYMRLDLQLASELILQVDEAHILRKLFRDLAAGQAVQPSQQLVVFPQGAGDFINYLGVLAEDQVYGIKTSPYIVREQGPLVTAWTLLMSMQTGQPLLLCDAAELTTARTAATTAVAVDALAPHNARRLVVIGSGPVARAHVQYVKGLRDWQAISLYSPGLKTKSAQELASITDLDPRLHIADSLEAALHDADVVMLCTSSAKAVLDPQTLGKPALITSISTNAPQAHEVPPQSLNDMDVFCDYRQTTPGSAGEMLIAGEQHGWQASRIIGDLPELLSEQVARPDYQRHVFFRSIGLGLEDVALANALYRLHHH